MTHHAREVLNYCKLGYEELKKTGFNENIWILRWVSVIALLRAIGHIHHKKDMPTYEQTTRTDITDEWYATKVKEPIFKNFIDDLRNITLKEFDFTMIELRSFTLATEGSATITTEAGEPIGFQQICLKSNNQPIYHLLEDAIAWWEAYLNEIDKLIL